MQGQLRKEPVSVLVETSCAQCGQPLRLTVDDQLAYRFDGAPEPILFVPQVDFTRLKDPSIIDAF